MFRMHKTLDVITLFHSPQTAASTRVSTLLKQLSAQAQSTATEDQASSHEPQNSSVKRDPFDLEITEAVPTDDQVRSIVEYLRAWPKGGSVGELLKGGGSGGESEILRKIKEQPDAFARPVVVDWSQGRVVVGEKKSEILDMLREGAKGGS